MTFARRPAYQSRQKRKTTAATKYMMLRRSWLDRPANRLSYDYKNYKRCPRGSQTALSADLPASAWRFLLVVGFTAAVVSPAPGAARGSVKNARSKARNRLLCQLPVNDSAKLA
jgi:hypothetical protein